MAVMWKRELRQGDQLESGNKEGEELNMAVTGSELTICVKKPAEKEITNSVLVTFNLRCLWKY